MRFRAAIFDEAVFVDDIPANVEAARSLGMTGIVFETTEGAIAEQAGHFPATFGRG